MRVIGLCGSLRARSWNRATLRAVQELAPQGMTVEEASIADIPLYNDDVRAAGFPDSVQALKEKIAGADGLLIVSPEYNYSVPGVLKNTLDWLSRGPLTPVDGKPVAIMGASTGLLGTARAQYHLRQVLQYMNAFTLNKPEVFIGRAETKFDAEGRLTDPVAVDLIAKQLVALLALARRLQQTP